jgi:hypothetical protein
MEKHLPQHAATEEYDGNTWTNGNNLNTCKKIYSRSWNSNCRFSFWWISNTRYYRSNRRIRWKYLGYWWKFKHKKIF